MYHLRRVIANHLHIVILACGVFENKSALPAKLSFHSGLFSISTVHTALTAQTVAALPKYKGVIEAGSFLGTSSIARGIYNKLSTTPFAKSMTSLTTSIVIFSRRGAYAVAMLVASKL